MIAIGPAGTFQAPPQPNLGTRIDGFPVAVEDVQMFEDIRPGDRVTIVTAQQQERTGRCVMKFDTHAVLNMGGNHGHPGIVTPRNIVRVKKSKQ